MPRVPIAAQALPGGYIADGTVVTYTASNTTDDHQTPLTGREILIARNTGASTRNIVITSQTNRNGRVKHISDALATGVSRMYGPFPLDGWSAGGVLQFEGDHAEVTWAILRF